LKNKLLGIGGVSRKRKKTLANVLRKSMSAYGFEKIEIISQDDYTLPEERLPRIKNRIDWEQPDSIDWTRLLGDIKKKKETHDLVIVEGIFVYYHPELNGLYDYALFLTIRKDVFMARRKEETRWGEEPEWYLRHVWQSYLEYGLPSIPVIELEGTYMWIADKVIKKLGL
jgi:uridine kinase